MNLLNIAKHLLHLAQTEYGSETSATTADYDENGHFNLQNRFTLEEMENIVEWVDQHSNARFATISNRFKKIKSMNYITRFREYTENSGTRLEKLEKIKEFMFNEFYRKRAIEKEAVHDVLLKEKIEYYQEK